MKITKVDFQRYELKLNSPYTIAYEVVSEATNFILKLETDSGLVGYGCAAPDWTVTRETPEMVEAMITEVLQNYLPGKNPFHYVRIITELKALFAVHSSTLAMVDMALLDLVSKKAEVPLYQFLGGFRDSIATSITIGICSLEETMAETEKFIQQGFHILKIKGGLDVESDIERILKIRERFPHVLLRFDGNQGYTVKKAIRFYEGTLEAGIEIFEQPIKISKEGKLGKITNRISIPVMADESLKTLADGFRLISNDRIDMINIKLMKVGGIMEGMHINSLARSNGIEAMVGCNDECELGIAAGLHFALSRPNIHYADLDGHLDFVRDPTAGCFRLENGVLYPSERYGLGMVDGFCF
jgi:L-Ala-D/L-Glu epimerase